MIGPDAIPARIGVTTDDKACLTVIEATARPHAADVDWAAREHDGLVERAARAGGSIDLEPIPGGVRYALRLPLDGTAPRGPAVSADGDARLVKVSHQRRQRAAGNSRELGDRGVRCGERLARDTVVMTAQQQFGPVGPGRGRRHDHPHDRLGRAAAGRAERSRLAGLDGVVVDARRALPPPAGWRISRSYSHRRSR